MAACYKLMTQYHCIFIQALIKPKRESDQAHSYNKIVKNISFADQVYKGNGHMPQARVTVKGPGGGHWRSDGPTHGSGA